MNIYICGFAYMNKLGNRSVLKLKLCFWYNTKSRYCLDD